MSILSLVVTGVLLAVTLVGVPAVSGPRGPSLPTLDRAAADEPLLTPPPAPQPALPDGKGPIGWEVYRQLHRLPELLTGVETRQFSSFDRAGYNDDGFTGKSSCLRRTGGECVLAEHSGPGEVQSLWFTPGGGKRKTAGHLRIELDGKRVVDAPLSDLVDGRLGPPFVYPLVANADQSSGGVYIKVPMPFTRSMRVSMRARPNFYHVAFRAFADAERVTTFDPGDQALDVVGGLRGGGRRDPKPAAPGAATAAANFDLAPGATAPLARVEGPGLVSGLRLRLPQVVGAAPAPPLEVTVDQGEAPRSVVAAGGSTALSVRVDPRNQGVRLLRRAAEPQVQEVLVDGRGAGAFSHPRHIPSASGGAQVEQTLEVPAAITAGRDEVSLQNLEVAPGTTVTATSVVHGQEAPTYELTASGQPQPAIAAPARLADGDELLEKVRVRISFDGRPAVDAPLGEFFGSGLGEYHSKALFFALDPGGWYSAWWPMPFQTGAVVELYNGSSVAVQSARSEVTWARDAAWGRALQDGSAGYFHAQSRGGAATAGRDFAVADLRGQGKLVGVSQTIRGGIPGRLYLEGDDRIFVDGARTPAVHGTGTEDFYEAGWYFNRGSFSAPFNGATAHEVSERGCRFECDSAYRLFLGDAIPFGSSLRFGMEHGASNNFPAQYSTTTFWYGRDDHGLRRADAIDVGDAASERAHGYTALAPAGADQVHATFEGDDDEMVVGEDGRSTFDGLSFRLAVPPDNRGVKLRRLSDQAVAGQTALVRVDGLEVGTWASPLHNGSHRWLEDTFLLPAALTTGRSVVTVELVPQGTAGWQAAAYEALAQVTPALDELPPGPVGGIVTHPREAATVNLSWRPAADDVGVDRYEVYATLQPEVPVEPRTLLGTTPLPAFVHDAPGIGQRWFYRVRAIDRTGRAGVVSPPVAGTSGQVLRWEGEQVLPERAQVMHRHGPGWSGSAHALLNGREPGDSWTATVTVPTVGHYELAGDFTRSPANGLVSLAIDGLPIGGPVDTWAPALQPPRRTAFGSVFLNPGRHRLTTTVVGQRPGASGYRAGLDEFELRYRPAATGARASSTRAADPRHVTEGELSVPPQAATAPVVGQDTTVYGPGWSGAAQLLLRADRPGDAVSVTVEAPAAGLYDVCALLSRAPDFGIVGLAVDGHDVGVPVDAWAPVVGPPVRVTYGTVALDAGRHTLTLQAIGKRSASQGLFVGLDALVLEPRPAS